MKGKEHIKEIDFIGILKKVFENKKILAVFLIIGAVFGIIVSLVTPKTYQAEVILAPEMSSAGLGMSDKITDMASTFGLDVGGKNTMDAIYPEIYPSVFASTDFILSLFDVPITLKGDSIHKTYYKHIIQDLKPGFWDYPKLWIKKILPQKNDNLTKKGNGIDPFHLTKKEENTVDYIRGAINCLIDQKTSVISISIKDQDPQVSAIMADTLQNRLQAYITEYKTKKARTDLAYYTKLYNESKQEYRHAQQAYASFVDANQDIILQSFASKRDEMENEMQIKYNIYTQMTNQMQNAMAKVQEQTPAFTIIQQATVPNRASSRPRVLTVLIYIIIAFMFDVLWVLFKGNGCSSNKNGKKGNKSSTEVEKTTDSNDINALPKQD